MLQTSTLHSVQSKPALSSKTNFLVYVLTMFLQFVKKFFSWCRNKTKTSTNQFITPYKKNDLAFANSFLVFEPVFYGEQSRREGLQHGLNNNEQLNQHTTQILIQTKKTSSSINFFNQKSMQTN